ncbi:unnamed protein product [Sphagnum compactum]
MEKEGKEIGACSYRGEAGRRRYEQLKDSVRTLRSHIRHPSSSRPSSSSSAPSFVPLPSSLSSCPLGVQMVDGGSNASNFVQESAPPAPMQQQLLHIQFQIQQQDMQEEIRNLQATLKGKAQQIEHLEREHNRQLKKLGSRIHFYSDKVCTLEAQSLPSRLSTNEQKKLQVQVQALLTKIQQSEIEKLKREELLKSNFETAVRAMEEEHVMALGQAQKAELASRHQAEQAEATVKVLAEKIEAIQLKHGNDTKQLIQQKEMEFSLKLRQLSSAHENALQQLRKEMAEKKTEWEKKMEYTKKRHLSNMQHYKIQKAKEMDELAERVKLTVESKDANIALLKVELANQQQQAFDILNGS